MSPTNFPGSTDALTNPTGGQFLETASVRHSEQHTNANDALEAIEKVIVGPSVYNVKGYGAVGNGTTNDKDAIQSAIDAMPTAGGTVFFPPGTYRMDTAVTLATGRDGVQLSGAGATLRSPSATNRIIDFDPGAGDKGQNISIEGLAFSASVTRTNNEYIRIANCEHVNLRRLRGDAAFYGIVWANCFDVHMEHVYLRNSVGVDLLSGGTNIDTYISNVLCEGTAGNTTKDGLLIDSGDSGVYVQNSGFTQGDQGVIVRDNTPANGRPEWLLFDQVLTDQTNGDGWSLVGGKGIFLDNCWGSTSFTQDGMLVNGASFVFIRGGQFHNNDHWGILVQSGSEVHIRDCLVGGNSVETANTYDGISFAADVSNFGVRGCRVIDDALLGGGTQLVGIRVSAGASDNYIIADNDLRGTGLSDGGTGTNKIVGPNLGVAPPTYAASNVTTDRTYNANATTVDELADVLGTLIADLRAQGYVT